jgi:hypothetical protein
MEIDDALIQIEAVLGIAPPIGATEMPRSREESVQNGLK